MPLDADAIRSLAAQHEGTRLDFKSQQYDWKSDGNLELAKDLMAMANALSPGGGNAYILVGVKELSDHSGEIVGVAPTAHLDDASMHQKVHPHLNRTPDFSYTQVDVGGLSVGVFEVRPGRRPIFATVTKGPLVRGVARYRDGSSTPQEGAWPDRIVGWFQEDHANLLREAEVEALRIQTVARPVIVGGSVSGSSWEFHVRNGGMVPFTVSAVSAAVLPSVQVWRENGVEPPADMPRFPAKVTGVAREPMRPEGPGAKSRVEFDADALTRQLLGRSGVRSLPHWFDVEIRVEVEGPTGQRSSHTALTRHPSRE